MTDSKKRSGKRGRKKRRGRLAAVGRALAGGRRGEGGGAECEKRWFSPPGVSEANAERWRRSDGRERDVKKRGADGGRAGGSGGVEDGWRGERAIK